MKINRWLDIIVLILAAVGFLLVILFDFKLLLMLSAGMSVGLTFSRVLTKDYKDGA